MGQPKNLGAGNDEGHGVSQIFSVQQMSAAAQHANEICTQYGVTIVSINVVAAALLEGSSVAVDLAKLEKTGQILGEKTSFFFGASPATLPALMSNPKCLPDCV